MWQPMAPVVVITVAQKELRRSSVKRENSPLVGMDGRVTQAKEFYLGDLCVQCDNQSNSENLQTIWVKS